MKKPLRNNLRIYIDEAGRGPLAGPVTVGLVMPLQDIDKSLFNDSKLLSEKKRDVCFEEIRELTRQ